MKRHPWTSEQDAILAARYPDERGKDLAEALAPHTLTSIFQRAKKLGLKKSEAFKQSDLSGRQQPGKVNPAMQATQFKPGSQPFNKGLKRPEGWAPGRMRETQFKKGERTGIAVDLYKPIGSLRITVDGYLQQKVNDDFPTQYRWTGVHRLVWEEANGPVPKGHVVVFKPGTHTTDIGKITLDRLELITRAELMRRNSYHTRYPKELGLVIQMKGQLTRRIRRIEKEAGHEEQA
ncbi:MAG: HNH endonuclease [Bacteroidetes bacterium]|nr:HNH endonuclease [Bacteroidota bacterium]